MPIKNNRFTGNNGPFFTVASLVGWPLNESETRVDLVLIETSLRSYTNAAVLMLN